MSLLVIIACWSLFGLMYIQTKQGPLIVCLWALTRLRASVVLLGWSIRHIVWWSRAHWPEALAVARKGAGD